MTYHVTGKGCNRFISLWGWDCIVEDIQLIFSYLERIVNLCIVICKYMLTVFFLAFQMVVLQ